MLLPKAWLQKSDGSIHVFPSSIQLLVVLTSIQQENLVVSNEKQPPLPWLLRDGVFYSPKDVPA